MIDFDLIQDAERQGRAIACRYDRYSMGTADGRDRGRAAHRGARPAPGDLPLQGRWARRGRAEPVRRRVNADAGRAAEASGAGRGPPVLDQADRGAAGRSLGGDRLGRRPELGVHQRGGGPARDAVRALGRGGGAVAGAAGDRHRRRRARPAGGGERRRPPCQPAPAGHRHARGVRQAHRPCRPHPRGRRRPDRRGPAARLAADVGGLIVWASARRGLRAAPGRPRRSRRSP